MRKEQNEEKRDEEEKSDEDNCVKDLDAEKRREEVGTTGKGEENRAVIERNLLELEYK